jgi:hypothetical protein
LAVVRLAAVPRDVVLRDVVLRDADAVVRLAAVAVERLVAGRLAAVAFAVERDAGLAAVVPADADRVVREAGFAVDFAVPRVLLVDVALVPALRAGLAAGSREEFVKSARAAVRAVFRKDSRPLSADALLAYGWDDAITEPLEASRENWNFPPAVLVKVNFAGTHASCCRVP